VVFQELASFYKGKYKKPELQKYWDNTCIQAKPKAKATGKPKFQPKRTKPLARLS